MGGRLQGRDWANCCRINMNSRRQRQVAKNLEKIKCARTDPDG